MGCREREELIAASLTVCIHVSDVCMHVCIYVSICMDRCVRTVIAIDNAIVPMTSDSMLRMQHTMVVTSTKTKKSAGPL